MIEFMNVLFMNLFIDHENGKHEFSLSETERFYFDDKCFCALP